MDEEQEGLEKNELFKRSTLRWDISLLTLSMFQDAVGHWDLDFMYGGNCYSLFIDF